MARARAVPIKKGVQYTKKEIEKNLKSLPDWRVTPKYTQISKSFAFPDFIKGLAFVAKVAVYAEVAGHHPDIELSYGKVTVHLTTHEAKGLTKKDFELAGKIESLRAH